MDSNAGSKSQYLRFELDGMEYGVAIQRVREINRISPITPVPNCPSHIAGIINLRGNIVPIMDLRKRLKTQAGLQTKLTCIIFVEGKKHLTGWIVDRVLGVSDLEPRPLDPRELDAANEAPLVLSVGKTESGLILLLDVDAIAADESIEAA